MLGYRSYDAVITVCQNNLSKSIEIVNISESSSLAIGYDNSEIAGRNLLDFIPERLALLLSEYVEYELEANDLGAVLSKLHNFSFTLKNGEEKTFRLKIVRGQSTRNKIIFQLILQDSIFTRKDEALRRMIQENFKGHEILHQLLGLPDRASLEKDIELATYYYRKASIRASFVLLQIDNLPLIKQKYGNEQCLQIVRNVAKICRSSLRPDDVVGAINDYRLGILLLDSDADSTRMVVNRLRWQIASQNFAIADNSPISLTASAVFSDIKGNNSAESLVDSCMEKIDELNENENNRLLEV